MGLAEQWELYEQHQQQLQALGGIAALLGWDRETHLPAAADETRAQQIGELSGIIYRLETDERYVAAVQQLDQHRDELNPDQQRSVALTKRSLERQLALDEQFVTAFERLKSKSQSTRVKARKQQDFSLFAPLLEEMVEMVQAYAKRINPEKDPYDVLLDKYEEGMDQEQYDRLLLPIKEPVIELVEGQAATKQNEQYAVSIADPHSYQQFVAELVETVGFDLTQGAMGQVEHPFATNLGPHDERINYSLGDLVESTYGLIHELGHGLYDMSTDPNYAWTNLSGGVSLGVHESQSRLLENMIGKTGPGVTFLLSLLQEYFPTCKDWTADGLLDYVTHVAPTLIRIHADEVTYNLHILLRYELEKALITGDLSVVDLPTARNEKMEEYLGIRPANDAEGCLQDVHRSMGMFGYFPTYMLGNLIGAQLWASFVTDHPNWFDQIAQGDFSGYTAWFGEHIWQHGSRYTPQELIKQATGSSLRGDYFVEYLQGKYR